MTVTAIVPIFNEEKTVGKIVNTLVSSPLVSEVICVNDGSTDNSRDILKGFQEKKIRIINLRKNRGKGFALAAGIKMAEGNFVAFFDSDLLNFCHQHIEKLLEPAGKENLQAIYGVPLQGRTDIYRPWVTLLTGERVYYRKALLPHLARISKTRYGVETFLNSLYSKAETKIVPLDGLISPSKWEKRTPSQAIKEYILELREIAEEFGKKKGLFPGDYRVLNQLAKAVNFAEFKEKAKEIKNKAVKEMLEKYLLEYLNLAKRKVKDFLSEDT